MCLPLRRAIGRSSSEKLSESVVVSLEDNVDVFSQVCFLKIEITEDIDTGVVKVCLLKMLINSPNQ